MKSYKDIVLRPTATIKEAIEVINSGSKRVALVVENGKLLGIIADADIRRAMLRNLTLDENVENVYNKNPCKGNINDSKQEIIAKAIEKNIYEIPIVDNDNNLVGFETLTHLLKSKSYSNIVVLMAGGLGTRLRPLTNDTPKPLLKVGNKPILETIIENFKKYGFKKFLISVNYKSHMIESYFRDGENFGVEIEYIHENKKMGTAGALSLIKSKLKEPFFVMNGDLLTNIDFESLLEFHIETKAVATMCVREYDFQLPYGVVNIEDGDIISIEEKPIHKFFVNAGIYMLSPEILNFIPENNYYDMPTLFEELIQKSQKTVSFPIREYWLDIGRLSDFERANREYGDIF